MQNQLKVFKISSLSARDVEKLFALMAGYRLIDLFNMAQSDMSCLGTPSHCKQPFIGDPEMLASKGWNHLHNWVGLACDFKDGLHT